jgi:multiple sugar transport system substrate-binding protein
MNVNSQVSRRRFLQISGLTAGAAFIAACTAPVSPPAATTGGGAAAPAAGTKKMEAWSQMTDVAQESLKGIIDNYNKSNKIGAELEFVYIAQTQGSQSDEKLLTAIAGGNPPALHNADRFTVPQFAHQGFFTNVAENAKAAGVTADQYFDFAWQEASYKDGLYALPFDTDTRAYWYNMDIMKEAGLDPEKPPQTLDELKAATETMSVRGPGGNLTRFGFHPMYDQAWLYTWGFAFKGEFQDPETKRITFSHPNNIAAMEYMKKWVDEIGVKDLDALLAACAGSACNGPNNWFFTGQLASTCSGDWTVSQIKQFKPDTNYGVVAFPGPDGPAPFASWAGGWSWAVPKGYKDVESAFDALAYMCGPEGQTKYNKDTYHIPTLKSVAEDPYFREDPQHALFMDLLPVSHTRPPVPNGSKLWDMQYTAFRDEIPHGTKTPEEALKNIDDVINKELEEMGFFS